MHRVIIDIPDKTLYSYMFTISEADINEANHMGNERILVLANEVRGKMFEHLQLLLNDSVSGHGTIIANHTIQYKNEGFQGEEITCHAGISNVTECSFDLVFQFVKDSGKTLALVRSGCVYYEYNQRKIRPLPQHFLRAFGVEGCV